MLDTFHVWRERFCSRIDRSSTVMLDKVISMDQDAPSLRALFDRASRPDGSSCAPWAKLSSALCRNAWLTSDCVIGSGMREGPLGFMQEYTAELREAGRECKDKLSGLRTQVVASLRWGREGTSIRGTRNATWTKDTSDWIPVSTAYPKGSYGRYHYIHDIE